MYQSASRIQFAPNIHALPSGLRVVTDYLPYVRSACIGIWIKTGSVNEEAAQAGISHFLEHLFFKGTNKRSARELMEAIEGNGSQFNAFTTRDYTCLYIRSLDTHVETSLEILGDIVRHSQFYDFEKERNVILEEIAAAEDTPEEVVSDLLTQTLWPLHVLGRPIAGYFESVSEIALDAVWDYYSAWYRPENCIITLSGSFDEERIMDWITREFGGMAQGPTPQPPDLPRWGAEVVTLERDITQSHLNMGFRGPAAGDRQRYAYEMLASALGGGSTSRLFDRIREQEGLAYAVYACRSSYALTGLFEIYAAVAPENLRRTHAIIIEELRRFRDAALPSSELELNREQLRVGFLMALESPSSRMSYLAKTMIYHGRVIGPDEVLTEIDAITADAIQALAEQLFRGSGYALAIVNPMDGPRLEHLPL